MNLILLLQTQARLATRGTLDLRASQGLRVHQGVRGPLGFVGPPGLPPLPRPALRVRQGPRETLVHPETRPVAATEKGELQVPLGKP